MDGELLAILEQIEREKGIQKEKLIQAIEQALVVAARKIAKITNPSAEISVKIDPESGKIRAFVGGEEILSESLARIAAQTAKQVIIQKIREAEKEVIFNEFKDKVGSLISGSVYRFEKAGVVLDLLGKTEAIIPKRELSPLDSFKLGERVRAYCLEVKKDRTPQVIASRRMANFVKKLFELEVPEIYEGIVEIKSIARDAGDRTKIAVYSKDEKVDCVGACVGMRGSRVKNIVQELKGEKIDIVRYSEDPQRFIRESLSPAEVSKIVLNKEERRALVVVDKSQLSLAIGKGGQNVRLASRLTGWELDIRSKEEIEKEAEELHKLKGVGTRTVENLIKAGFQSLDSLARADIKDLSQIKGIGKRKAEEIIEQAKKMRGR
ncbi:MAG: transcription termination/antitermination protein NusA [Candidatus Omnitrophica bacterium]|nr:transcription termination/antitermination protein NusA [Candidatus Omnitrophota bacterium]